MLTSLSAASHRPTIMTLLLAMGTASTACGDAESLAQEEAEREPASVVEAPLVSGVDCAVRRETAYRSGRTSTIDVIRVGGKTVTKATGHAFLRMQRAADSAGVYLALNSGFRTYAEQQYLYDCYLSGSCNDGNLAAAPGYSNHQSGVAVDLTTSSWLAANASRFGFVRTVPSEDWHYEFSGADPGGPCAAPGASVAWVSPKEGGWYTNGVWFKVHATGAVKVRYVAGAYLLGESTAADDDFPLRYTFSRVGDRSVTATTLDAAGRTLGQTTVLIRVVD